MKQYVKSFRIQAHSNFIKRKEKKMINDKIDCWTEIYNEFIKDKLYSVRQMMWAARQKMTKWDRQSYIESVIDEVDNIVLVSLCMYVCMHLFYMIAYVQY